MGSHIELIWTGIEEGRWIYIHHPENEIIEDRLFYNKKIESAVQASIGRIKNLIYTFSQLRQRIEHLEDLDNEISIIEDETFMGNPKWMGGSQYKG